MLCRAVMVLGLALTSSCAKAPQAPQLQPVTEDTVEDQGATFSVNVSWRAVDARQIELVVKMAAIGIEQTDKLVVDVETHGFVIAEGVPDWAGFVLPREKYTHRVRYSLLDDQDSGRASVTIRRSLDSTLLWDAELLFDASDGQVRLAP